ncbi:MAG: radical SAM protein [Abditibacteriota bacterium]|nr:radical SAM protein [Abditibacteriota bacterium]
MTLEELGWADTLVKNLAGHIAVRERDSLLILIPNRAYKLNDTGLALLSEMLEGKKLADILEKRFGTREISEDVIEDIHCFFCDLRALTSGCGCALDKRRAVELVPFERPYNTLPVMSEVALTYRCNLSCRFCYAGCSCTRRDTSPGMDTEDVKKILGIIKRDAQVPSVSWTGGEPLLRKDICELTRYASEELGMKVNLITNGTLLTPALADGLREAGLKSAQVSLEGGTREVHEALTRSEGSFEKTLRAVKLFRERDIFVHTNTTLNRMNADKTEELADLVASLGTGRFSMNLMIPAGSAVKELAVSYSEAGDIIRRTDRYASEKGLVFMWYSPTPYCLFNPVKQDMGGKSCAACDGLLSVSPDGDVLPCSSLAKSVGNLLRTPFEKIWFGRRAEYWKQKKYAHRSCRKCETFNVCAGACPIYWKAMGYKELKEVFRGKNR